MAWIVALLLLGFFIAASIDAVEGTDYEDNEEPGPPRFAIIISKVSVVVIVVVIVRVHAHWLYFFLMLDYCFFTTNFVVANLVAACKSKQDTGFD